MNNLSEKALDRINSKRVIPELPGWDAIPHPAINKAELYLSFHGNDHCAHCITCSGPHREELMPPEMAFKAVKNISKYSILQSLEKELGNGAYRSKCSEKSKTFDRSQNPPEILSDQVIQDYADCIMGKGYTSSWISEDQVFHLNFGRPSIRLSGGEFFTWPHRLHGKKTPEEERLYHQKKLLSHIRKTLPEYDIWILTNGRFAENAEKADKVIQHWAPQDSHDDNGAKTRITVSVDAFHRPPRNSTVEEMLNRLWSSTAKYNMPSPYIYSVTHKKVFLVGRAFTRFHYGFIPGDMISNVSGSSLNEYDSLYGDPNDLMESDGCDELKGFVCRTPDGIIIANNIVINYNGHLAYCCVCVGDYGDFISNPQHTLKQIIFDPVSLMLKNGESAAEFLGAAVDLDPSIKLFGNSNHTRAMGSTCYQVLSGRRIKIIDSVK